MVFSLKFKVYTTYLFELARQETDQQLQFIIPLLPHHSLNVEHYKMRNISVAAEWGQSYCKVSIFLQRFCSNLQFDTQGHFIHPVYSIRISYHLSLSLFANRNKSNSMFYEWMDIKCSPVNHSSLSFRHNVYIVFDT